MEYHLISAGTHVNPPGEMWYERFPREMRERAPRVVRTEVPGREGVFEALEVEGVAYTTMTLQTGEDPPARDDIAGLVAERSRVARSLTGGRPGSYDPLARLADMDADGVDADVIVHPGFPIMKPKDRATKWGMMRAFNDWLGEFCSAAPARLVGVGEIPVWDIDLAIAEARHVAALGLRGVLFPVVPGFTGPWSCPADRPYFDPFYEPLWAELAELGLVIVGHNDAFAATPGLNGYDLDLDAPPKPEGLTLLVNKSVSSEMIASMIWGGVFERHPSLQLTFVETGVGWMAHLVTWMDALLDAQPGIKAQLTLKEKPSHYFRRNVSASFLWDSCGIATRDIIGIDCIMWCNDYPHTYGPWPHSAESIDVDLAPCTPHERHQILAGNAQRIFRL
jgi:predicted TIM-barrel fold metal-dependent hydrolase